MKHQLSQMMFRRYQDLQLVLPSYNPEANFEWIRNQSGLPWLQLDLAIPYETILDEIHNIQSWLTSHRDNYGEHEGWRSFCLHGKSYDATREDDYYNDDRPHVWTTKAQELMPKTVNYFSTYWPATQFQRVRVMLLEPGGYITVHSDSPQSRLSPINIAITQPKDCDFLMERHGIVPFSPGQAFWLDVSNRHVVFNNSIEPRWHIIVHQNLDNIEFQKLVVKSYKRLYNKSNEDSQNNNT
jgi:hypothetical protein